MGYGYQKRKVDRVQPDIVAELKRAGATVESMHRHGKGCPDLLVGYEGIDMTMELKEPGENPTDEQESWHLRWRGHPVIVAHSADEAVDKMREAADRVRRWREEVILSRSARGVL